MQLISGENLSKQIIEELKIEVAQLKTEDRAPCVAFIRVGENPASVSYVTKKQNTAAQIGIKSQLKLFPEDVSHETLFAQIDAFNNDETVDGILVQAPLPKHISETETFNRVSSEKDVDGFGAVNLGKLCQEDKDGFVSCTPAGIIEMIKRESIHTDGKHVVIVGRSLIVGKPSALLFLQKQIPGNATVTVCHSRTHDLAAYTKQADILITALGSPNKITDKMVQPGTIIIDVGINRIPDPGKKSGYRLVGDTDFESVAPIASKITPVPGGVGPMTVAMLMKNTVKAYRLKSKTNYG